MTDRYVEWDAAYVLGALAPAERLDYEQHLGECVRCRAEVSELAGIPGLLGHVDLPQVLALDAGGLVGPRSGTSGPQWQGSDTQEGAAAARPIRARARGRSIAVPSRWAVPAAAALLLVTGAAGGAGISALAQGPGGATVATATAGRWAFSSVGATTITAVVDVSTEPGGTLVAVECQYADRSGYATPTTGATLALWVVDDRGEAVRATTWQARTDEVMRPTVQVPTPAADIARLEIRDDEDGAVLMTSTPPGAVPADA